MYNKNIAVAIMMISVFGEDLIKDENKEQGLITLHNPNDDCYCTLTKAQYDNLFTQIENALGEEDTHGEAGLDEFNDLMADGPMYTKDQTNESAI